MHINSDDAIQMIYTVVKNIRWRDCDENSEYEWYYAEDMHYMVRNKKTSAIWFIKAKSPSNAYDIVMKKVG